MKAVFAVVALAALVAVVYGAPATNNAPDWTVIGGKVNEIEAQVAKSIQEINNWAKADNPSVGADIERKLAARIVEARAVLAQARSAIEGRSLTEASAREFFARLRTILETAQSEITPDVRKLSEAVQYQIRLLLEDTLAWLERIAQEIYAELRKLVVNFAPDWSIVGGKVNEIEAQVAKSVQEITNWAKADNPSVGADIERKLAPKVVEARAVLAQARTAIEGRSLTEASAKEFFARLRTILEAAQADITPDVRKLSEAVQYQIRLLLEDTLAYIERIAEEIYAELRKLAVNFAPDWTVIGGKVNDIEAQVVKAVQEVTNWAKADNPTVGADIERKLAPKAVEARAVLAQARSAIKGRSLTDASARAFFASLRNILGAAEADITPDVHKLSEGIQRQIRSTLEDTVAYIERLAGEIYAELRK